MRPGSTGNRLAGSRSFPAAGPDVGEATYDGRLVVRKPWHDDAIRRSVELAQPEGSRPPVVLAWVASLGQWAAAKVSFGSAVAAHALAVMVRSEVEVFIRGCYCGRLWAGRL